jgi:predicted phage terminase large subunit-like protein
MPVSPTYSEAGSEELALATELLRRTVIDNPFIPSMDGLFPSAPQAYFLTAPVQEILYGGAAGGGKSAGILAAALQYATEPGYDALIVRRSYADLEKPGGLIPLSHEWLLPTRRAEYNQQAHRWTFDTGATLSFGHIQTEQSVIDDYQGSAFSFIGFDELTQFTRFMYTYLFSRKRKRVGLDFPTRVRATSNPGGRGHDWVYDRFPIKGSRGRPQYGRGRLFIPAVLEDNPGLNRVDYEEALSELDPVTRAQLRHGDWEVRAEGNLFKREWFAGKVEERAPVLARRVRFWDLAATEEAPGTDPDFTATVLMGVDAAGTFWVEDADEFRASPADVEKRVATQAELDGRGVEVWMEQEPGGSGKSMIDHYARTILPGYDFHGRPSTGDKITRAKPFSAACQNGLVRLVRGSWIGKLIDRLTGFGLPGVHDDMTDASSGAHLCLTSPVKAWDGEQLEKKFANFGKWRGGEQNRDPSHGRPFAGMGNR